MSQTMSTHLLVNEHAAAAATGQALLPSALLDLSLVQLRLPAEHGAALQQAGLLTVGDTLALRAEDCAAGGRITEACREALRAALAQVLNEGLAQFADAEHTRDWPTLRVQLLAPLDAAERDLFASFVGLETAALLRPELVRRHQLTLGALEARAEQIRARLHIRGASVLHRLRYEIGREMAAFDGVMLAEHVAKDSLLHTLTHATDDRQLGLRLAALCLPPDFHLHRDRLFGISPRRFRRLLRALPRLCLPHRLPLSIDTLQNELAEGHLDVPRGLLLHVLRADLRVAVELDGTAGEIAVPDPRSPGARLAELLLEAKQPMTLENLVFAYRERYRRASRTGLLQRLQRDPGFVSLGPDTWSLRRWHEGELHALTPLVDKVARRICAEGGRQNVVVLLADDKPNDRKIWLVLDRLAHDPRVRLLGRGDLCPASHTRSQVLELLLADFRRAAGDVVLSMFLQNQPTSRRRLVERLLRQNRLFVLPGADRIDLLSNYPFNEERLQRLVQLVRDQLERRAGYAQITALKLIVDRHDLGGGWLTTELLTDLLRRHGPFEVLPGGLVARAELDLSGSLMRSVRQALRDAGHPVSVEEVLRTRPDLCEFTHCLTELLQADPLVQTPDGAHFTLV